MRTVAVSALLLVFGAWPASAGQQADPALDRIRAALSAIAESPAIVMTQPPVRSWGGMTMVQPDTVRGEFVRIKVPVGEITMKAARAIQRAHYHRAERKARERVDRALQDFIKQQSR
ncbi:MAG: hypothetical protein K2Y23_14055 [Cyanobacteria bacterium]|nr:hypothetical protein [Cyanobacteriota bacterium]